MRTGYYNEQKLTDERLTKALKHVQKRLRNGETWSRKRTGGGITLGKVLPEFNVSTKWSHFFKTFDYSKRITEGRISRERHAWQTQEAIKAELRRRGLLDRPGPKAAPAPKPKPEPKPQPEPVKAEVREKPVPKGSTQGVAVKLSDFAFTDRMTHIKLRWMERVVRDRRVGYEAHYTTHLLEPQVYAYEERKSQDGGTYMHRRRLRGDFRQGALTPSAQERIVQEGREQMAKALPGRGLERLEDTLATMRFLMR